MFTYGKINNINIDKDTVYLFDVGIKSQFRLPIETYGNEIDEFNGIIDDDSNTYSVFSNSKLPVENKNSILFQLPFKKHEKVKLIDRENDTNILKEFEVLNIRIERLQDISEKDLIEENIEDIEDTYCERCEGTGFIDSYHPVTLGYEELDCPDCKHDINKFINYWNHNFGRKDESLVWKNNPFVWVIDVKVL